MRRSAPGEVCPDGFVKKVTGFCCRNGTCVLPLNAAERATLPATTDAAAAEGAMGQAAAPAPAAAPAGSNTLLWTLGLLVALAAASRLVKPAATATA